MREYDPRHEFRCARLLGLAVGLLLGFQVGQAQNADVRLLEAEQTIERELRGAESQRYRVDLKQGEFLRVQVEQKGIDVVLVLFDEQGRELARTDSPNGVRGFETISFVADVSGTLVLEVGSLDKDARKGGYTIRSDAVRTATAEDRANVRLERALQAQQRRLEALTGEVIAFLNQIDSSNAPETVQAALSNVTKGLEIAGGVKSLEYEAFFSFLDARVYEKLGITRRRWSITRRPLK